MIKCLLAKLTPTEVDLQNCIPLRVKSLFYRDKKDMKKQLQSIDKDIEFGNLKLSASKCKELFEHGRKAQQNR